MSPHALEVLELAKVLQDVASYASSPLGREAVLARTPSKDADAVRRELVRVGEVRALHEAGPDWALPPIPDARVALSRLGVEGAVLDGPQLASIGILLRSGRLLAERLQGQGMACGCLASLHERLVEEPRLEGMVERTVDTDGQVLDTASKALQRLRPELGRGHGRIVLRLEAFVRSLPERLVVADASVSIRDGRYVVAIRREGKRTVGGVVRDESSTGTTLYVEPPVAIQLMNDLCELEREERREVLRVLREASNWLQPMAPALTGALAALIDFDSLWARARAASEWRGEAPEVLDPGAPGLRIVGGAHPLLLSAGEAVVPFDIDFERGERALVVSGPNTGGKSVFLKAFGLLALLTQSGVVPPVRKGTRLPIFEQVYADIGDEQSIAQSLSTFSAHLGNVKEVLECADAHSLVLIDEMGTGTDPAEGAALARAVLEEVVARGAVTVVSSHLGALKHLDEPGSGIVNASFQFDVDSVEPTYVLVKGRPGMSYGLAIARRLGFPAEVLDRADGYRSSEEANVEDLLDRLARKEREAADLVDRLGRERADAARLRAEVDERSHQLERFERSAERRTRDMARRMLLEARGEVEEAIREVRAASGGAFEEEARRARGRVETAARRQKERTPRAERRTTVGQVAVVGQMVRLGGGGAKGVLVEVRRDRGLVDADGVRLEVPLGELTPLDETAPIEKGEGVATTARQPLRDPPSEPSGTVDLRGLRVDEVELQLSRALDAIVVGDSRELVVIHGKGTGAVRERVHQLLRVDTRVRDFRLGCPGEGGAGVTVVEVRA